MAGSLDDNPPQLFPNAPNIAYHYLVLGHDQSRIYVSKESPIGRHAIATQLRRLADYLDTGGDGDCDCGDDHIPPGQVRG